MKFYSLKKAIKIKPEIIFWFFLFLIVFSLGFSLRMQSSDVQYNVEKYNVITSDGVGYYSYLPSVFVKKELQISDNQDHYLKLDQDPITKQNKYFVGSAILMAPFFGIAHCYTTFNYWASPNKSFIPNGYSFPYQLSIIFAGVFYLVMGLFHLKKTMLFLGVKKEIAFFLIIVFALGTQLMGLASYEASFSHIYAFFTIALLIYNWNLFTFSPNLKRFIYVGFLSTLLILIRPTDLLILLTFPIFWILNGYDQSINWLKQQRIAYLYLVIIGLLTLYLQLYFWKQQSGAYFIWSYSDEGFNFSNPEMWKVLFSYKKGLFIYTPLLIVTFIYIYFSSINITIKIWFSIFFIFNTYVISSWWCWWYGGSFGMRAWMDFMPIIIVLSALALNNTKLHFKIIFYILALLTIPINMIQNYQYCNGIMHWDTMTHDKYWQIFLKTDKAFDFVTFDPTEAYKNHVVIDSTIVKIDNTFDSIFSVEKNNMFYTLYEASCSSLFSDSIGTYVKVSFDGKLEFMRESAVLTANKNLSKSDNVNQESQRIISYIRKTKKWVKTEIIVDLGIKTENETDFSLFFYNNQCNYFWFRNVKITFYNYQLKPTE